MRFFMNYYFIVTSYSLFFRNLILKLLISFIEIIKILLKLLTFYWINVYFNFKYS